jgi:hypothetical protein
LEAFAMTDQRDTLIVKDGGSSMGTILGIIVLIVVLAAIWFFFFGPGTGTGTTPGDLNVNVNLPTFVPEAT